MPIIILIIVIALIIMAIIAIVRGIANFLEHKFIPFFFDAGEVIAKLALFAIATAITLAIFAAIFLFFRAKITPILHRYKKYRQIREAEKEIETLLNTPTKGLSQVDLQKSTDEKIRTIEKAMELKKKIAQSHIDELRDEYENLIKKDNS